MANYSSKFKGAEIDKRLTDVENKADKSTIDSLISTMNLKIDTKADKSDLDSLKFMHLTEAEYEALEVKDSGTVYFVS